MAPVRAAGEPQKGDESFVLAYTVLIEREDSGEYFASWTTGDGKEGGCAPYSATVVGALAELCATLLKVDEDKSVEARASASPSDDGARQPQGWQEGIVGFRWAANGESYVDCLEHFNRSAHRDGEYERLFAKDANGLVCDVCQAPLCASAAASDDGARQPQEDNAPVPEL